MLLSGSSFKILEDKGDTHKKGAWEPEWALGREHSADQPQQCGLDVSEK